MRDVVVILREWAAGRGGTKKFMACEPVLTRAADEIERLRADVQKYKDKEAAVAIMWHDPASQ